MRLVRGLYLGVGVALLWLVAREVDGPVLIDNLRLVGWGVVAILALHVAASMLDVVTWQLTLRTAPMDFSWLLSLWRIRLMGESVNTLTPLGGMGGEPVKAVLLDRALGVNLREGTASLLLAKTTNLLALIVFIACGLGWSILSGLLPLTYSWTLGIAYGLLALGIVLFFLVQRARLASRIASRLQRYRFGRSLTRVLHLIHDLDDRLVAFYARSGGRFSLALLLAFLNWLIGIVEVYFTMLFIGQPITLAQAGVVEACVQLVRATTFYIPAAMGTQDGAFVLLVSLLTGNPAHGLTVALVRRFRELCWVVLGLVLAWRYSPAKVKRMHRENA